MSKKTITSANSTFVLTVETLFPAGVSLEGYAADAAFMVDAVQMTENLLGVDGKKSSGWLPQMYSMSVNLQADSNSVGVLDAIAQFMNTSREIVWLSAVITVPSTGLSYVLSDGTLEQYTPIAEHKKTQAPKAFKINWGSILPAVI